eukprot:1463165-Heterocapsa_arctica.AAC.1
MSPVSAADPTACQLSAVRSPGAQPERPSPARRLVIFASPARRGEGQHRPSDVLVAEREGEHGRNQGVRRAASPRCNISSRTSRSQYRM